MNKFLIGLLLGLVSVFIISCNNTSVTSTPDDDLISNNIYQNNYFSFSLPLPENWAIADNETEEKLSQTVKEIVVKNDPELEVEVDKAAKRSYQLLLISQHPIKTGDASNAVILINSSCELKEPIKRKSEHKKNNFQLEARGVKFRRIRLN